ncbi:serine/threonine-protein kinase [Actinoplanes octamycinicus]|uniref:non-specific serine/threonine protein kinase n=1 Tax=Actinoplanes octamycinicus TaxID=135948 RepID=A0A7W7H0M5_9ACTN|nr:serine/threonine-protein kinase [Actinoplanes octamycinicus]MBB4741717.1 serine/threonine-protein kinase [Actinoplanes octamycinicus]GIE57270.1 hypothetical protein Aoc01nite_26720 [Actinoplanes octamycinicus]
MARRVLGDRYELHSLLGRGGMAEVWEGVDRRLGRAVAVKVMRRVEDADSSLPARFDREARTVAGLSHPNIVPVHDVGAHDGVPFLVMELVDGDSLADLLELHGRLPIGEAVRVAIQVCAALEAAAAAGVVHRDLKPANILITDAGLVKVCDFGLARRAGAAQAELTGIAQMIGTSTYMAPEQVTGSPIDARTDLYGLGCVLYAMVTGQPPFVGDTAMEIAWKHVENSLEPASRHRPDLPADLDRLLGALLAKYPADRPAGPREVRAALESLTVAPVAVAGRAQPWFRLAGLAVVVTIGIGGLVALLPPEAPEMSSPLPLPSFAPPPTAPSSSPPTTRPSRTPSRPAPAAARPAPVAEQCDFPGRGRPAGNPRAGCPKARGQRQR